MFGKFVMRSGASTLLFCLALAGFSGSAVAQKRVYAKVEPNAGDIPDEDKIYFDVNIEPTDNIAPNVVFSPDSKRGYVGYAGSGIVLAFNVETGEILERIDTGGHPNFSELLPDQETVAVVSAWDNKIFLIDSVTSSLRATYTFDGARFGFGSILTLSPDGLTGYISSTDTGEVIKFRLSDGAELARMGDVVSPAQITVTPDGSTLMVVDTYNDELVFADTASLRRKFTMKNGDPNNFVDFTIVNRAVLAPDGETGIIASHGYASALQTDTIIQFKTSTGEILKTARVGSGPSYTGLTPDGKKWVILNQYSITVIPTDDFEKVAEYPMVAGNPLDSANIAFSPDSKYAYYASSARPDAFPLPQDLVFQQDLDTAAIVGRVQVGDNPNTYSDQPSTVTLSPDGETLAVVDFLSNRVELLTDVTVLYGTRFNSSADEYSGLSLINLSQKPTNVTIYALTDLGQVLDQEGITNPVDLTLEPNQQITQTISQLFTLDGTTETTGWIAIFSVEPEVVAFMSRGDMAMTRLTGFPAFRKRLHDWIVPEIFREDGKSIDLNFLNPNYNQASYDLYRLARNGDPIDAYPGMAAYATNRQSVIYEENYTQPKDQTEGYLRITSVMGLAFTEFFGEGASGAALNGIDVDRFKGVNKVYSPQFAITPGYRTILNVINASQEEAEVTVTLHDSDGTVIGQPFHKTFVKNEQLKEDLAEIFKDDPAVVNVTGWIEVESSQDSILGTVTFANGEGKFLSGFELSGTPSSGFLFPVLANDPQYQTGIALLNSGSEPAEVTLEVWGTGGTKDRSATVTIPAGSRKALYLSSYFPDLEPRLAGNIRVHSDKPLYGFALINDGNLNFMMPMPMMPLPQ